MKRPAIAALSLIALAACVSRQRDHFYTLQAQPASNRDARTQFDRQVMLRVTVPSMVDRGELVLANERGVAIFDHERWAAPLADLVTGTLGQDIEKRRADVVVLPRRADQAHIPAVTVAVDIDQVNARLGEPVAIEVHWRITDHASGNVSLGRDHFAASEPAQSFSGVAAGVSSCVALLADRLVQEISKS